jgi:hypothetical protein
VCTDDHAEDSDFVLAEKDSELPTSKPPDTTMVDSLLSPKAESSSAEVATDVTDIVWGGRLSNTKTVHSAGNPNPRATMRRRAAYCIQPKAQTSEVDQKRSITRPGNQYRIQLKKAQTSEVDQKRSIARLLKRPATRRQYRRRLTSTRRRAKALRHY